MALINNVPTTDLSPDPKKPIRIAPAWTSFFEQIFNILSALTQSGTTAQRPTVFLWVGRPYFDTSLGIPIWFKNSGATGWVNASGSSV